MAPLVSFSCIWRTDSTDMSRNFLGQLFLGQSKIFDNIFGILTKIAARRAFFPREMELFLMGFLDNLLKKYFYILTPALPFSKQILKSEN